MAKAEPFSAAVLSVQGVVTGWPTRPAASHTRFLTGTVRRNVGADPPSPSRLGSSEMKL